MALFPASPSNGATANVNGYQFTFNSTDNAWNRTQSFTGSLAANTINVSGNANVGNLGTVGLITATGNITGGNLIGIHANGNSNVNIPAANGNVNISAVGNANIVVVTGTGANITGTLNISGNTTFSGVGQQILGDFSNATLASRTVFQSKTTDTATDIPILPNGTAAGGSSLNTFNLSNIANSAYIVMGANSTITKLYSATTGTATLLPLVFGMGSTEAARFDTGGNFQFSGTGQRIQGDFSNGTIASRTMVQDKTTNNGTNFFVIPNGTNANAGVGVINSGTSPGAAGYGSMSINSAYFTIQSSFTGGGTGLPMSFRTGGSERMRIENAGTVTIFVPSGGSSANVPAILSNGNISGNPNTTANVWKQAAFVANGGFGGGIALNNGGGSNDGFLMYLTSTPSQLNIQYGSNGGNTGSAGVTLTSTGTSWSAFSDERLKTDLQPIANAIQKSSSLRTVTGRYKTDPEGTVRSFLIAQDVLPVVPSAVSTNEDGMLLLSRDELIPLLFATVNELSAQLAELKTEVNNLKNP